MLGDLDAGGLRPDCGDRDLGRIKERVVRYADLPLGFSDACVVTRAERNGGKVLTSTAVTSTWLRQMFP